MSDRIIIKKETTAFVGIDPGKHGAAAIYIPSKKELHLMDFPLIGGESRYSEVSWQPVAVFLKHHLRDRPFQIVLEKVGAMPKQGVVAMFNFGQTFGAIKGMLAALEYSYDLVTPQRWKKAVMRGVNTDDIQLAQCIMASRLFPAHANQFCKKTKDHNKASAALMAWYIYSQPTGKAFLR